MEDSFDKMSDRALIRKFLDLFKDPPEVKPEYRHLFPLRYPNERHRMKYAEYREIIDKVKAADTIKALTDLAIEYGFLYAYDMVSGEIKGICFRGSGEFIEFSHLPADIPGEVKSFITDHLAAQKKLGL